MASLCVRGRAGHLLRPASSAPAAALPLALPHAARALLPSCSPACASTGGWSTSTRGGALQPRSGVRRSVVAQAQPAKEPQGFGYSRKDVILVGVGLIALGYAMYYGLQAAGMEAGMAGNWVQMVIFLGICVGWISSYLFRVATKQMTYVKQLEAYEDAVIRKRLEEMTEEELGDLVKESEAERARRLSGGKPSA